MSTLPQMRSKHLIPFAAQLRKCGSPVTRVLRLAGLPETCLQNKESLIPVEASSRFRELVARRAGSVDVALKAVEQLKVTDLGDFGLELTKAPTLQRSLTKLGELVGTQTSNVSIELYPRQGGQSWFCHRGTSDFDQGRWHRALYMLGWMLKIVRMADADWLPAEIWIDTNPSAQRQAVIESLGCRPRFAQDCTGFLVPASLLALAPAKATAENGIHQVAVDQLWSTAPATTYAEALEQLIRSYVSDGWLGIRQASEAANTSVRTMQRRLSAENTTYSQVVEETRSQMAGEMLENTAATMTEISHQLGYRHPGDFTRAFRRWAGVSPSEFRQHRRTKVALQQ